MAMIEYLNSSDLSDSNSSRFRGFSLIEVVLAIGVLALAVIVLIGIFTPTVHSIDGVLEQRDIDTVVGIVNNRIQNEMTWDEFTAAVGPESSLAYLWKRIPKEQDSVQSYAKPELVQTGFLGLENLAQLEQDSAHGQVLGMPILVVLERTELNDYDYQLTAKKGYIPARVNLYALNMALESPTASAQERMPLFSYTTAKTRLR